MTDGIALPKLGTKVPSAPDWLHEVKYDGYRLRVERNGDRVRLITRNGYDWTNRYPWIVKAALKNRQKQFVIDGEAVILGVVHERAVEPARGSGRSDRGAPRCRATVGEQGHAGPELCEHRHRNLASSMSVSRGLHRRFPGTSA